MKTISKKDDTISLEKLIKWATYNGAQFLGFKEFGSIEKGKTPGLNLIEHIDVDKLSLKPTSNIKKLS